MRRRNRNNRDQNRINQQDRKCVSKNHFLSALLTTLAGVVIRDLKKDNSLIRSFISKKITDKNASNSNRKVDSASYEILDEEDEKKEIE